MQEDPQKQHKKIKTKEKAWVTNCKEGMSEQEFFYTDGKAAPVELETRPFPLQVSTQETTPPSTQRRRHRNAPGSFVSDVKKLERA